MTKKGKFKWSDLLELGAVAIPEIGRGLGETLHHAQERELKELATASKEQKKLVEEHLKNLKLEKSTLKDQLKNQKPWYENKFIKGKSTKEIENLINDINQEILLSLENPLIPPSERQEFEKEIFNFQEAPKIKEEIPQFPHIKEKELEKTKSKKEIYKEAKRNLDFLNEDNLFLHGEMGVETTKDKRTEKEKEQADQLLNFMKRTGKNYNDFTLSILPGMMEMGEGATGIVGAKDAKQWIRDKKYKYEEALDIDRNSLSARGGRFLGEMLVPMGAPAKLFKWAGKAAPLLKALTAGGAFGAVASEAQDENPLKGALYGASTGAIMHGLGSTLSKVFGKKKMAKELAAIKKDATLKTEEEILHAADLMGKKATIGEIVGSEKAVQRMKKGGVKRLENIEGHLKEEAGKLAEKIPQNEKISLYQNLEGLKKNVTEEANQLYDVVKESGIGNENILDRKTISSWINALKEVMPHTKGLPNLKGTGIASPKAIQELEYLLMDAPKEPKAFRDFVITHEDRLPYAEDFLKFRRKIHKLQEKSDSTNKQALDILNNNLDKIIKDIDVQGSLAKADKNYATKTSPFKQDSLKEAITSGKFTEASKGAPKISTIFAKQSPANSQLFEQLPTADKKRVIGGFVEEAFEKRGKEHPSRAINEAWHMIPDYIKLTDDKELQQILKGIKAIAQKNKTLSSLQQTTNASIGSRSEGRKANAFMRTGAYGGSLLSGKPSVTAGLAVADLGIKGSKMALNKAYRSRTAQKNLKYYLKPELLEEIIQKEEGRYTRPISRALINLKQYKKDNYVE